MKKYAIILCGGSGTRMGCAQNKTLLTVRAIPAVVRCIRAFAPLTDGIVLVARAGEEPVFAEVLQQYNCPDVIIVPGGPDRQTSELCGIRAIPEENAIALIHDGARPFVTQAVIENVLQSVEQTGSGVAAVPARDTIKRARADGLVLETPDRAALWQVQTPQGFYKHDLLRAHAQADKVYTDDAALMEAAGFPVHLVMGDYANTKLTSREDLSMIASLPRIGHGFDAHRLVEGRALWLGGVQVPYEKGLLGHSDADAPLHALMDALLGAAGLPDIGHLFPDNDPAFKDISSLILLERTREALEQASWQIGNCDVTIVAQAPKLAPYLPQMRQTIARALRITEQQISLKATTTEKMGYEGRGEGISAHAVVLLIQY